MDLQEETQLCAKSGVSLCITLHSLCHDPTSPGGANPTYAPFAGMSSL